MVPRRFLLCFFRSEFDQWCQSKSAWVHVCKLMVTCVDRPIIIKNSGLIILDEGWIKKWSRRFNYKKIWVQEYSCSAYLWVRLFNEANQNWWGSCGRGWWARADFYGERFNVLVIFTGLLSLGFLESSNFNWKIESKRISSLSLLGKSQCTSFTHR